jgi:protease-4
MDPDPHPAVPPQPVQAQVVGPQHAFAPRPSRPLRTLLTTLLLVIVVPAVVLALAVGGFFLANALVLGGSRGLQNRVQESFFSHNPSARQKIAILSVEGVIVEGEGFIGQQIERARKDDDVKAVVLRVDSPGGTITASDYIHHHLCRLTEETNKPLVVSMGGLAASGGYYVSMAVGDTPESIFAEPTTWTGSIGVIIPLFQAAELMEKLGVEENAIVSHPLKDMGSFSRPLTEEERAIFQQLVDESFGRFKEVVKSGRPKFHDNPEALDKLATGQIFTADQALEHGLIDEIGFIEKAIDRAIALAGLSPGDVRVVKYTPEPTLADVLLGGSVKSPAGDLSAILDLGTPRAYYLWTRIPPLIHSGR